MAHANAIFLSLLSGAALVLGLALILQKSRCERYGREENVNLVEVGLPLRPKSQSLQVFGLPVWV